jgi:hypothetical protein
VLACKFVASLGTRARTQTDTSAWEAEHGRRLAGRKPTRPDPAALAARKINTTDPDKQLMKRAGGKSVRGYNVKLWRAGLAQAATAIPEPLAG